MPFTQISLLNRSLQNRTSATSGFPEASRAELWGFTRRWMRRASLLGRGAEERGREGCIRCRNLSNDFFIHPSHLLRRSSPKGRASRREKDVAEPYFGKLPNDTAAKPNYVQRSWDEGELAPGAHRALAGGLSAPLVSITSAPKSLTATSYSSRVASSQSPRRACFLISAEFSLFAGTFLFHDVALLSKRSQTVSFSFFTRAVRYSLASSVPGPS